MHRDQSDHEKVTQIPIVNGYSIDSTPDMVVGDHIGDVDNPLILVLEDSTGLLKLIVDDLKSEYNVLAANNGKVALEKLGSSKIPDLIISDLMMDEMDGIEFLRQIRSMKKYQLVPLILLSAKSDLDSRLNGYQSGAVDYYPKPISLHELRMKVNALLTYGENQRLAIVIALNRMDHKQLPAEKLTLEQLCLEHHITGQEKLAIQGILDGKTSAEKADELHISKHTVTKHISNMFQKLKVKSRNELTRMINDST